MEEQSVSGAAVEKDGVPSEVADSSQKADSGDKSKPVEDVVSKIHHKRVLDDMHKYKAELVKERQRVEALERRNLEEKQNYKELWEKAQKRIEEVEGERGKLNDYIQQTQRFNAVKNLALKEGIRAEALNDLELIDMSDVHVEVTSNGRFITSGEQDKISYLKNTRPHWFETKRAPEVNPGGGGAVPSSPGKLSPEDVMAAERKFKMGKISKSEYQELFDRYCQQNPRTS